MTSHRARHRSAVGALIAALLLTIVPALPVSADSTAQTPPFSQDWTNPNQITADDNWSGVPGIIGIRGDNLTGVTGTDPQTVLVPEGTVDVTANQTNPNTFTTGGVTEFDTLADPVVALQGSGTARAPHLILTLNTTGLSNIHVAYNLRDVDGAADNAIQPVALQYRVGGSGNYTNIAGGFVADATTGPSLATLVTPVSVTLPAAANNQAIVNVRVITTDASGSDEWVGVDDITVTAVGDQPPAVQSTTPANGATGVAVDSNITVNFNEPVAATEASFSITCETSSSHALTVSGGPDSYIVNPAVDFAAGEICTVTVIAAEVADQDTDDPPNNLNANHVFSFTTASAVDAPELVINEIDYDQPGTDASEFLEIKNVGSSAASLNGVAARFVNGATGLIYATFALPNTSLAAGDYFVICANAANTTNCDLDVSPETNLIQNGPPDAVALVVGSAIIDTVSYAGNTAAPYTEGSGVGLVDTAAGPPAGPESISRCPDGTDADQNNTDLTRRPSTPGLVNNCPGDDVAPTVSSTTPANGAAGVAVDAGITINLSEPVNVTGPWYSISCGTSGGHTATVAGGPGAFTLDPDIDFVPGETCTVTVAASGVTDQDLTDPPDAMDADYLFSFTVVQLNACEQTFTPIYDIQGNGPSAAMTGIITTQGVVVGDFEGTSALSGFYLQDVKGDSLDTTSDGIFVFTGSADAVSIGQLVRVTGFARERFNQTSLNGSDNNTAPVTDIVDCGIGTAPVTDVTMPFTSLDFPERFEGMSVRFPQALVISEYFNYDQFGEIVLALPLANETRPFTPTAIDEPGAPAQARLLANRLSRITLDDGSETSNPAVLRHPNGDDFSLDNRFRGGDTAQNAVGVLGFGFSAYRIQPTGPADYVAVNPRSGAPAAVGGSLRVAAQNTLNFFLTLDYPTGDPLDNKCSPSRSLECRGADSNQPTELTRQRDKLLAALRSLNADVLGLNEIENTPGVDPLGDPTNGLVTGLNAGAPGTYAYIDTGVIGTDAIRVGLIYRPGKVKPVGTFKVLTTEVDPRFIDTKSRPVLAQTFEEVATGARFTVAVNHLKSKGSACDDVGDPDGGDGQGNCNGTRELAAQALVDWLATDPSGSGDPDFLVIGDLNAYAKEDPIDAILAGPDDRPGTNDDYTNLVARDLGTYAYSYVFDGQAGYLDHALSSASLTGQVTGVAEWHINADESDVLDYDTSFKPPEQDALYEPNAFRSSDHDPILVGLQLSEPPTVDAGGPYSVFEGGSVLVSAIGEEPGGGDLTYAWDLDNDGSFETPGQSVTFSAAELQAPRTLTIAVRATSSTGFALDEATVNVIWDFGEFKSMLDLPAVNDARAGDDIALKFSLTGDQGFDVLREGYPASESYGCGTTPPADATVPVVASGPHGFRYDSSKDEYTFVWKTDKAWNDTCRVFVLGLADGTTHNVAFHFK